MNEVIVFITLVILIILVQLLASRLKQPFLSYVRILASLGLLILIWLLDNENNFGPKLILTGLALTAIWRGFFSLKKLKG